MKYSDCETHCPSCGKLWIYQDPISVPSEDGRTIKIDVPYPLECQCGASITQLRSIWHNGSKISTLEKVLEEYTISWDFNTNSCRMYDTMPKIDNRMLVVGKEMPWLPLDITKEQLKLYLTFS